MNSLDDLHDALGELERRAATANAAYAARTEWAAAQPAADGNRRSQRRVVAPAPRPRRLAVVTAVAVVTLVVVGGGVAAWQLWPTSSGGTALAPGSPSTSAGADTPDATRPPHANADASGIVADPEAPPAPLLAIYEDYQCPYCAEVHRTMSPVIAQAVAGHSIRVEYRTMTFLDMVNAGDATADTGQSSSRAANAAACADGVDHFVAYHDYLFEHQPEEGTGYSEQFLRADAPAAVGLTGQDLADFQRCYDARQFGDFVAGVHSAAIQAGINGTPTYVLDGVTVALTTAEALQSDIDAALAGRGPTAAVPAVVSNATPGPVAITACVVGDRQLISDVSPPTVQFNDITISGTAQNPSQRAIVYRLNVSLTDTASGHPLGGPSWSVPVAAGSTVHWQGMVTGLGVTNPAVQTTGNTVACSLESVNVSTLPGPDLPRLPATADELARSLQEVLDGAATVTGNPSRSGASVLRDYSVTGWSCPATAAQDDEACGAGATQVQPPMFLGGSLTASDGRTGDFKLMTDYAVPTAESHCPPDADPSCRVTTLADGSTLWSIEAHFDNGGVGYEAMLVRSDGVEINLTAYPPDTGKNRADGLTPPLTLAQLEQAVTALRW